MNKDSSIVVTGARGLVGSALMADLASKGYTNVIPLTRSVCDLTQADQTHAFFEQHQPDYVFHAAARVYGIMGNMKNKALSFYDNVLINTHLIHAATQVGVKKITVMGTGAVYPYPSPGLPLKETMIFQGEPHHAEDSYAHAKRAMLAMLKAYEESHGLSWAYIVSCNLFGPRDNFDTHFGHVVPSLIKKFFDAKQAGTQVSVWGDGSAQRDFMYVEDTARVAHEIMMHLTGPVNIGSGCVFSIKSMVEALGAIADLSDSIVWDASKPNGQDYRAYDLSKINALGFQCAFSIEAGLQSTWDWYCAQHKECVKP
jgi:GDP-L-fucose synthase